MLRTLVIGSLGLSSGFAFTSPSTIHAARFDALSNVRMAASMRTNDVVKVISGDDKGTVGKLLMIDTKKGKVVVEGVNMKTKHVKPMKEGESGSILKKEFPISISNVKLADEQPAAAEAASE